MLISKLALCAAVVLLLIGQPVVAASAAFAALIAAALEYAAIRAANPSPTAASDQTAIASPAQPVARSAPAFSVAGATAVSFATVGTADHSLLRRLDADFGLEEPEAPAIARETSPPPAHDGPSGAALAVTPVAMAPGMLDIGFGSASDTQVVSPNGAVSQPGVLDAQQDMSGSFANAVPADQPDPSASRSSLSALVADDGWSSEPPGGY